MKALIVTKRNGLNYFIVKQVTVDSDGYFRKMSKKAVFSESRVYLSYIDSSEKENPNYDIFEKYIGFQYDKTKKVLNEQGCLTRGAAISFLRDYRNLKEDFIPYSQSDLLNPITYGELGYLLVYGCKEEVSYPKLGSFKPDSRTRLSIIQVEGVAQKMPEYRLGQYSSSKVFDDYLEDIRTSARPVPVPLYYGFNECFGSSDVTLFGQVPRGYLVNLVGE